MDNTLYDIADGSLSNGAGGYLLSGATRQGANRRAVIAFDVESQIPAGSTINDVTLTLHMDRASGGAAIISLHKLTATWGEGTSVGPGNQGGGGGAATNDATWLHRFFDSESWQSPGGDFESEASANLSVSGIEFYTWGSTSEMVQDVQSWLDEPDSNAGWILIGDEAGTRTAKRFDSRESSLVDNRPVLIVTLTPQ